MARVRTAKVRKDKMERATKIMVEMWGDIQFGKVKRFMEEIPLSKAGSSTHYGTIESRLMKANQLSRAYIVLNRKIRKASR